MGFLPKRRDAELFGYLKKIRAGIYRIIAPLEAEIYPTDEPLPFADLPRGNMQAARPGMTFGKPYACAWLHLFGNVPEDAKNPVILVGTNCEGLVYDTRGNILTALSNIFLLEGLPHSGDGAKARLRAVESFPVHNSRADIYVDCGYNGVLMYDFGRGRYTGAYFAEIDQAIYDYYYDFLTLTALAESHEDSEERATLRKLLRRSFGDFSHGKLTEAANRLRERLAQPSNSDFVYDAIGHGHLDLAWLWPIRETVRKAARTYTNALRNIEKYPGYIYGTSQPQQMLWMKEQYPSVYAQLKQAVADGRIELQGGFWTECDCNLSGGEALVRQALYGRRFIEQEFGKDMRICWLPDAFGFNGNLPQILKKSGMDYFSTIKLSWNKVNVFPHRTFYWEGIDGSRVLCHMPPEGDYNSRAAADNLLKGIKQYPERDLNSAMLVFGDGDGGGGPGQVHLELLKREQNLAGLPRVRYARAIDFFERLAQKQIAETYRGELYLEMHQGTYTTQGKIKMYNRRNEQLLHNAEALAVAADSSGLQDNRDIEPLWRTLMLHQFHDIIPGSSIERVNREAVEAHQSLEAALLAHAETKLGRLSTSDLPCAVNLTSFPRREMVRRGERWYFAALAPYSAGPLAAAPSEPTGFVAAGDTLSNGLLTLRFNRFGEIESCVGANGREIVGEYLNRLVIYRDKFMFPFDAWDIDPNYYKKPSKRLRAARSRSYIDGPTAVRENQYRGRGYSIVQRIVLEYGSDTVRVETEIDWHKSHRMLRADFRPVDYGDNVRCEIQFGHVTRATTEKDSVESAQFEVCHHKWAAVERKGHGFALLNDSKYGLRAKNGLLSLNLLRAPTFPDKHADRGNHRFTYAFCPFESEDAGKPIREGYRLNNPLVPAAGVEFSSLAASGNPAVVIETLKPGEDGGVVMRLYESLGRPAQTALRTTIRYTSAFETDLHERNPRPVDLNSLTFGPFEIKTILLKAGG